MKNNTTLAVISTAALLIGIVSAYTLFFTGTARTQVADFNEDGFYAVFLITGQVYFGQLGGGGEEYQEITNTHYLQAQQLAEGNSLEDVTLIRLGNELHQPKDTMLLARDNILLIQELKDDSRIITAIKEGQVGTQ